MGRISPSRRKDGVISLPDGRHLAYAEWGTPSGPPVLLLHGGPGSRLFCPDHEATMSSEIRLVTVDRPGYGRSDPKPHRTVMDGADDVAALADSLNLDHFAVVGFSAGGPYALACAVKLLERVTGVGIAGGARGSFEEAPHLYDEQDTALARAARTDLAKAEESILGDESVVSLAERPDGLFQEELTPEGDMWLFRDEESLEEFKDVIREGMRQGPVGLASDWLAEVAPWGFELRDVSVQLHIWHGEQDLLESGEAVDLVAEQVADCRVQNWPEEGHLGLMNHWAEMLTTLCR